MRRPLGLLVTLTASLATALAAVAVSPAVSPAATAGATAGADKPTGLDWKRVDIDTGQQFRGLDAVSASTAWVGGSKGGVWRTVDAGRTWQDVSPPGARNKKLLFRDVEAASAQVAQVLAIGEGRDSRIYRTTNGGQSWTKTFVNKDPDAFYDCMAMFDNGRDGLVLSDPVDGKFRIIATHNGGRTWRVVSSAGMPKAVEGEFAFAASGTCLVTHGDDVYFASGGGAARIFRSTDQGRTWTVKDSTLAATDAGGVFSLAFQGDERGIAVGGDFEDEEAGQDASATTDDRGRRWTNAGDLGGYRSGVAFRDLPGTPGVAVAVGPTGSDVTTDGGASWAAFSTTPFDAVQCVGTVCWASGPKGRVATLSQG